MLSPELSSSAEDVEGAVPEPSFLRNLSQRTCRPRLILVFFFRRPSGYSAVTGGGKASSSSFCAGLGGRVTASPVSAGACFTPTWLEEEEVIALARESRDLKGMTGDGLEDVGVRFADARAGGVGR